MAQEAQDLQGADDQGGDQGGGDPLSEVGGILQKLVEGISGSQLPPAVKQQAMMVQKDYQKLVQMIGGGGAQPMQQQAAVAGGNPNAQPAGQY